ncbi:MAG: acylneuraminate cytidylyltransferase family protein [Acidobacteria bacterium]|nr:acylneuraminate cytidylyltransferase family protein [Acidobacteriota bacterium]
MSPSPSVVALVPARAGSKRVPGKNVRRLGGHPVIAYTIAAAIDSGVFADVIVSTDDERYAEIARHYGARVPWLRPAALAGDASPDVDWVEQALRELKASGRAFDCFSLLRPTSPFRQASTIRRAWAAFKGEAGVDSLRAVERCRQHPGKMWIVRGRRMTPLMPFGPAAQPWHSSQTNTLPEVFVQNASLEIAWSRIVLDGRTIAGEVVMPFLTDGLEGFDLNSPEDWIVAEHHVRTGEGRLPPVSAPPHPAS